MNPVETVAMIRAQLSASTGWAIDAVEPMHHGRRSFSRHLTCRIRLNDGTEQLVFVKFVGGVSRDRARQETLVVRDHEVTTHLHAALRRHGRFTVPRPLACSREHLMLICEHVDATRLQDKIARDARLFPSRRTVGELAADCHRCGEWLRAFQAETVDFTSSGPSRGRDDTLDAETLLRLVTERVEMLRAARTLDGTEAAKVTASAQAAARAAALAPSVHSGIHADFFPGNVMVRGDEVIGIDFVMSRHGSIYFDPTYFIFQLETLASQLLIRRSVVDTLSRAFLHGFDATIARADFWKQSPMFDLLFLTHATARLRTLALNRPPTLLRRLMARRELAALRFRVAQHVGSAAACAA